MSQEQKNNWRPRADHSMIRARAHLLKTIRSFFEERGVLEVETPLLGLTNCPDLHIDPFYTKLESLSRTLVLQSSPEFYMKRLVADGLGSIFQICKAFRNSEIGSQHNPEFTMIEWYRDGWNYNELIQEVVSLLHQVLAPKSVQTITYQTLFIEFLDLDPWCSEVIDCQNKAKALDLCHDLQLDKDGWLDYLLTHAVFPKLSLESLWVIKDFPPSQAALANLGTEQGISFGKRFECYYQGVELANGYDELICAQTHVHRFEAQNEKRLEAGKASLPLDFPFLQALNDGLKPCAGVALGFDRLLMLQMKKNNLQDILAFPFEAL